MTKTVLTASMTLKVFFKIRESDKNCTYDVHDFHDINLLLEFLRNARDEGRVDGTQTLRDECDIDANRKL